MSNNESKAPRKGDVLYVDKMLYRHYGIYEGNNFVIHYAVQDGSFKKKNAVVHETSLEQFANGFPVKIFRFQPGQSLSPYEVVENARSRIGEKCYNLLFNNCEHFAVWCKTGVHGSSQVDAVIERLVIFVTKEVKGGVWKKVAAISCLLFEIGEMLNSPELRPLKEALTGLLKSYLKNLLTRYRHFRVKPAVAD